MSEIPTDPARATAGADREPADRSVMPHSPLPWRVDGPIGRTGAHMHLILRCERNAGFVAFLEQLAFNGEAPCFEANADLIVRAVNAHEDLLAALKEALALCDENLIIPDISRDHEPGYLQRMARIGRWVALSHAAIRKAESREATHE